MSSADRKKLSGPGPRKYSRYGAHRTSAAVYGGQGRGTPWSDGSMIGYLASMGKEGKWREGRKRGKEEGREGGRKEIISEMKETDRKGGVFPNAHSQERATVNLSNLINTHISTQNPGALNTSPVAFTLCPVHCPGFCPHRQPQKERSHQLLSLSFCRRQKGKRRSRAP